MGSATLFALQDAQPRICSKIKIVLRTLLLAALLSAGGCVHLVAPLSEQLMDGNHGKRTLGSRIEDQSIEYKARINLYRSGGAARSSRIRITSFNGRVLMTGQVADNSTRQAVEKIVRDIRHVRDVHNELTLSGAVSWLARFNDTWLTAKTKIRLLAHQATPGRRTKVVTESGAVYLMGLVTRQEAQEIVAQVQKVYGVQKIIKVLEYLD